MTLQKIEISDSGDKVVIISDAGAYTLTKEQIENLLIEDGQMCEFCHDTGEISTDESDGEGHTQRGVGTRKCLCKARSDDE